MTNISINSVAESFYRMPRFTPAIFSAFLCGLLLLFYRELGQNLRSFLIPSLVVYAQGSALVGTPHRHLGIHYVQKDGLNTERPIPTAWKIILFGLHLILFSGLIIYNSCRGVF